MTVEERQGAFPGEGRGVCLVGRAGFGEAARGARVVEALDHRTLQMQGGAEQHLVVFGHQIVAFGEMPLDGTVQIESVDVLGAVEEADRPDQFRAAGGQPVLGRQ